MLLVTDRNHIKFQIDKVSDTMRNSEILDLIWSGDARSGPEPATGKIQCTLSALLPVRLITLSVDSGVERFHIVPETRELLPDASLGDVLVEELGIDVPVGSLILLQDAALLDATVSENDLSHDVGMLMGEVLINAILSGTFPISREMDALYAMAASYCSIANGAGLRELGLVPAQFRAGLGASLCAYWVGERAARDEASGHFLRADFLNCPRLLSYLALLDSNFTRPRRVPAGVIPSAEGTSSFGAWLDTTRASVLASLDVDAAQSRVASSLRHKPAQASPEN